MKGEIDICQYSSRKYRCKCWPVAIFQWDFPLNNTERHIIAEMKGMIDFIGFRDPKIYLQDGRGNVFFVLFASKTGAGIAGNYIVKKHPGIRVGQNICLHYAACEPVKPLCNDNEPCEYFVNEADDPEKYAKIAYSSKPIRDIVSVADEIKNSVAHASTVGLFDDDAIVGHPDKGVDGVYIDGTTV